LTRMGADAGGGILDDDPLEAVAGPHADAVAGLDAQAKQTACDGGRCVPQLAVTHADVLLPDNQRLAVAVALDGGAEVVADGLAE